LFLAAALLTTAADRKRLAVTPKGGVTTPGVQMPVGKLKPEAEIAVAGAQSILGAAEAVWVGTKTGVIPIDGKTNRAGEAIAGVKLPCAGMATGFESNWVVDCGAKGVARLALKTNASKVTIGSGAVAVVQGVAASEDSVWVLADEKGTFSRIDPETGKVVAEMRLPAGCTSVIYAEKSLWVACPAENQVLRVDPLTNLVAKRVDVAAGARSLVFAEGSVWVLGGDKGKVSKVDAKTEKVTATVDLQIADGGGEITAGAGSIWVTAKGYPLTRIDAKTDQVMQQFAGEGGGALRFAAGSLWMVNQGNGTVWRVDPKRVLATFAE
ncbi:MAG: hypothetical protein JNK48_12045, partial [Bryobacterales bacterium]|nr:hypothetical protein [Bryobacterales bacterium]